MSKIKVLARVVSFLFWLVGGHRIAVCLHGLSSVPAQKERGLSGISSYRDTTPVRSSPHTCDLILSYFLP